MVVLMDVNCKFDLQSLKNDNCQRNIFSCKPTEKVSICKYKVVSFEEKRKNIDSQGHLHMITLWH